MQRTEIVIKIISFILTDCMHSNTWCSSMQLWEYHDEVSSKCLLVIKRFHPPLFMLTQAYRLNCRSWQAMAKIRWGSRFYAGLKFTLLYLWKTVNIMWSDLEKSMFEHHKMSVKYVHHVVTDVTGGFMDSHRIMKIGSIHYCPSTNPKQSIEFGHFWRFVIFQYGPKWRTSPAIIDFFISDSYVDYFVD